MPSRETKPPRLPFIGGAVGQQATEDASSVIKLGASITATTLVITRHNPLSVLRRYAVNVGNYFVAKKDFTLNSLTVYPTKAAKLVILKHELETGAQTQLPYLNINSNSMALKSRDTVLHTANVNADVDGILVDNLNLSFEAEVPYSINLYDSTTDQTDGWEVFASRDLNSDLFPYNDYISPITGISTTADPETDNSIRPNQDHVFDLITPILVLKMDLNVSQEELTNIVDINSACAGAFVDFGTPFIGGAFEVKHQYTLEDLEFYPTISTGWQYSSNFFMPFPGNAPVPETDPMQFYLIELCKKPLGVVKNILLSTQLEILNSGLEGSSNEGFYARKVTGINMALEPGKQYAFGFARQSNDNMTNMSAMGGASSALYTEIDSRGITDGRLLKYLWPLKFDKWQVSQGDALIVHETPEIRRNQMAIPRMRLWTDPC